MKLGVVGTGYVGLVTAAGFAARGHHVTCVDIDAAKVASLENGIVPWYEPGLSEIVIAATAIGKLHFTTDIKLAAEGADILFIAVGTPPNEDGSADTSAVFGAAGDIGDAVTSPVSVVIRSTVPVGTAHSVRSLIAERAGFTCPVLSNPEFLREGKAVPDFENPTRVVIGSDHAGEEQALHALYAEHTPAELIVTVDTHSAEMSKYASNSFLAAKISFMNEIATLCEAVGADIEHVRKVMGFDPRIGSAHLAPGIGYGGSCLPKDTQAVVHMGRSSSLDMGLLEQVHRVNVEQPARIVERLRTALGGSLAGKRIALWGLSFKPDTDDMREAPSLVLISHLAREGASICAYDPMAVTHARALLDGQLEYAEDKYQCVQDAHALVIVTEWNEFKNPDWKTVRDLLATPIVFDGRNIHDPNEMAEHGIEYYSIGRQPAGTPDNDRAQDVQNSSEEQKNLLQEETLEPASRS